MTNANMGAAMGRQEFEVARGAVPEDMPYAPDWRVSECCRLKDAIYRFHVVGENLNFEEGHPFRKFEWSVPDLSWRFFMV